MSTATKRDNELEISREMNSLSDRSGPTVRETLSGTRSELWTSEESDYDGKFHYSWVAITRKILAPA